MFENLWCSLGGLSKKSEAKSYYYFTFLEEENDQYKFHIEVALHTTSIWGFYKFLSLKGCNQGRALILLIPENWNTALLNGWTNTNMIFIEVTDDSRMYTNMHSATPQK